jgi:SAM-dependent methyltransferase
MNTYALLFGTTVLTPEEVTGKRVLEVGARSVEGSVAPVLKRWAAPREYIGVDIEKGTGVDVLCGAEEILDRFGAESFDLVISTEMIEHVRDWRAVIHNMKQVCKRGGIILVTTRSKGFKYHAFPHDYWRYEPDDLRRIFSDCEVLALETDAESPGVFLKARKPATFAENDLSGVRLYSILTGKRKEAFEERDLKHFFHRRTRIRQGSKALEKKTLGMLYRAQERLFGYRRREAHRTFGRCDWAGGLS